MLSWMNARPCSANAHEKRAGQNQARDAGQPGRKAATIARTRSPSDVVGIVVDGIDGHGRGSRPETCTVFAASQRLSVRMSTKLNAKKNGSVAAANETVPFGAAPSCTGVPLRAQEFRQGAAGVRLERLVAEAAESQDADEGDDGRGRRDPEKQPPERIPLGRTVVRRATEERQIGEPPGRQRPSEREDETGGRIERQRHRDPARR